MSICLPQVSFKKDTIFAFKWEQVPFSKHPKKSVHRKVQFSLFLRYNDTLKSKELSVKGKYTHIFST